MTLRDAPPDFDLLADLVESVEAGVLPSQAALEEVSVHVEAMAPVARRLRRRKAFRLMRSLLDSGEYPSIRAAAARVAREVGAAPDTVRGWLGEGPSFHP